MEPRNLLLKYLVDEYFGGDLSVASDATGYSLNQLNDWVSGNKQPQKQTVEYFMHKLFVPEFKVIVEYGEFDHTKDVRPQLKTLFKNHECRVGIYSRTLKASHDSSQPIP
jgi:hypothetical protein